VYFIEREGMIPLRSSQSNPHERMTTPWLIDSPSA
jgi:hypothetical protein